MLPVHPATERVPLLLPCLHHSPDPCPWHMRGRELGEAGYGEMSSPGRYLRRGECSPFSVSIEAEGAELAVLLLASELRAVLGEGSAWRVPARLGSFTLTNTEGG